MIGPDNLLILLKASIESAKKDREIMALKATLADRDAQIAALQAQMRRSTLPFKRDLTIPALLRPQAG